jgi:hypothetical protein
MPADHPDNISPSPPTDQWVVSDDGSIPGLRTSDDIECSDADDNTGINEVLPLEVYKAKGEEFWEKMWNAQPPDRNEIPLECSTALTRNGIG